MSLAPGVPSTCSSKTVDHLRSDTDSKVAPEITAVSRPVPVNLRCVEPSLQKYLWETNRYVQGLQALRPGNENLVIFGAIAGVPQYLVDANALSNVDPSDEAARAKFYQGIRDDSNMQLRLTPTMDNIVFACMPSNVSDVGAYPAQRILDVVEGFGENGIIQSICEDSFESAINLFADAIAKQLSNAASGDVPTTGTLCK